MATELLIVKKLEVLKKILRNYFLGDVFFEMYKKEVFHPVDVLPEEEKKEFEKLFSHPIDDLSAEIFNVLMSVGRSMGWLEENIEEVFSPERLTKIIKEFHDTGDLSPSWVGCHNCVKEYFEHHNIIEILKDVVKKAIQEQCLLEL